jgi:voltage-dependent calcium channel L type alpha-1D
MTNLLLLHSLPQEDSDYEREKSPPSPPPRKQNRRGASFKLGCIGKQDSDENPLMRKIATPLKLAQSQVNTRCTSHHSYHPSN